MTEASSKRRLKDWPYLVPMGAFMLFVQIGVSFKEYFALAYAARTFICGGLVIWLWKRFEKVRWTHLGLGTLIGIVGTVQWIGMECGLMALFGTQGFNIGPIQLVSDISEARDYPGMFQDPTWLYLFLVVRLFGPVLVVPVLEELFWRDWGWRTIAAPNDFSMIPVGEYERNAFWLLPVFFAFVHVQFITAIVWSLLIAWLLVRTRSIGACIVAHAVTNLLLGLWVLATWKFPGSWVPFGQPHWFFW
jgi:CAAX prenyl protease-like protein